MILESMNEEGHFDDIWNRYSNYKEEDKIRAYDLLNEINQTFRILSAVQVLTMNSVIY